MNVSKLMEQVAFLRDSSTKKDLDIEQLQQLNTKTLERKSQCREFQGIGKSPKIQRCKVLEYMQESEGENLERIIPAIYRGLLMNLFQQYSLTCVPKLHSYMSTLAHNTLLLLIFLFLLFVILYILNLDFKTFFYQK